MPTDPGKVNVDLVTKVSNDPESEGTDEVLTAEAIQEIAINAPGTIPTIVPFTAGDLVNDKLTVAYASAVPLVYTRMANDSGHEVVIPTYHDPSGTYVEFDFSELPGGPTGTWNVSIWTATGPSSGAVAPDPAPGTPEGDFLRIRSLSEIDLKTVNDHTLYTVGAGRKLVLNDLDLIILEAIAATLGAAIELDIVSGDIIVPQTVMTVTNENTRGIYDIRGTTNIVLSEGDILRLRVKVAGTASGNYTAAVSVSGYLV